MLKPAFSTVACPEWTLDRVALAASRLGYLGVELRTFDVSSRRFASDPALTDPAKVRRVLGDAGVQVCSVATDAFFDELVVPPVVGHLITDTEAQVRKAKRAIDLAASIEAPAVRVFGFRVPGTDTRKSCMARIAERLAKVLDHASKTGVKVTLENAGTFACAGDLVEFMEQSGSSLLRATYAVAPAALAGEHPAEGLAKLGDRALSIRVKDLRDGLPVALGTGGVPVQQAVSAAARQFAAGDAWCIFEWDRAWLPAIGEPEFALEHASRTLYQWIGQGSGSNGGGGAVRATGAMAGGH